MKNISLVLLALVLSGCATIIHGTTQQIPIESTPAGARVFVDSQSIGATPVVATLQRTSSHVITLSHDSFPDVRVPLDRNPSPLLFGNFLLYSAPVVVDLANGAAYGFSPEPLRIDLRNAPRRELVLPSSGIARLTPIPDGARATALASSVAIGFGSGHALLGASSARFGLAQLSGLAVGFTGLASGIGGSGAGRPMFIGGATVYFASRIWETADLVTRMADHNRQTSENARANVSPR